MGLPLSGKQKKREIIKLMIVPAIKEMLPYTHMSSTYTDAIESIITISVLSIAHMIHRV